MPKKSRPEMHLVLSDQHIPFQDPDVEALSLDFIKFHKPDTVHLLGDIMDFYSLSRFDKDPSKILCLQDDIDATVEYFEKLRAITNVPIIYSQGNHEARYQRFLWSRAAELSNLQNMRFESLVKLDQFKIKWVTDRNPYKVGKLLFTHGDLVRKWSGATARGHYEKYGCSVIHGHCFDDQTEILTPDGWVTHDKLSNDSIVMTLDREHDVLAWNQVQEVHRYTDFKELVSIKGRDIDLRVTGGHGLWVGTRKNGTKHHWHETTADERFGNDRTRFQLAGNVSRPDLPFTDAMICVATWLITEGNDGSIGELPLYRISQSDAPDGRIRKLEEDLHAAGIPYTKTLRYKAGSTEHGQYRNYDAYRYYLQVGPKGVPCPWRDTMQLLVDDNKLPTRLLAQMSVRQIKLFLDRYTWADGSNNRDAPNSRQLATKSNIIADFLQELACCAGYRTSKIRATGWDGYYVTLNARNYTTANRDYWSREPYNGTVWCVSVPNGTLLVRRGGHTAITLNTHRAGSFYHSTMSGTYGAWENGCLCSLKPEYMIGPDWQNAWSVVWFSGSYFHVEQVIVTNKQYVYHGSMVKIA